MLLVLPWNNYEVNAILIMLAMVGSNSFLPFPSKLHNYTIYYAYVAYTHTTNYVSARHSCTV